MRRPLWLLFGPTCLVLHVFPLLRRRKACLGRAFPVLGGIARSRPAVGHQCLLGSILEEGEKVERLGLHRRSCFIAQPPPPPSIVFPPIAFPRLRPSFTPSSFTRRLMGASSNVQQTNCDSRNWSSPEDGFFCFALPPSFPLQAYQHNPSTTTINSVELRLRNESFGRFLNNFQLDPLVGTAAASSSFLPLYDFTPPSSSQNNLPSYLYSPLQSQPSSLDSSNGWNEGGWASPFLMESPKSGKQKKVKKKQAPNEIKLTLAESLDEGRAQRVSSRSRTIELSSWPSHF